MNSSFDLIEKFDIDRYQVNSIFIKAGSEYVIYVKKKKYQLYVINREKEVIKVIAVSIGMNKDGARKLYEDDDATPEGLYYVIEILSDAAPKGTYSYNRLRDMNAVYFSAKDGHYLWGKPDQDSGRNAYGPRFFRLDYPNADDLKQYEAAKKKGLIPKDKKTGKYRGMGTGIGLHGTNDPISVGHKISSGCIRMNNEDVKLLDDYIEIGTPVFIE